MKQAEMSPTPTEESVTREPWERNPGIDVYVFNGPEAAGKIGVERGAYGLHVYVPGHEQPVALIDLFHLGGAKGCPQIVVHDTVRDDAVAFAKFRQTGTEVEFEHGVGIVREGALQSQKVFGYENESSPRCERCGKPYAAGGDGWDGKCPGCADVAEMTRENNPI
ncbi:MAG TPA: hypothetical protein VMP11_10655 [Verrucomicrobiae bacterium]|nr:hypothetical protein [Verrucomicrobiae bacterium]